MTPRSAWSSPPARRSSSTTPAGTTGSGPPPSPCSAACSPRACRRRLRSRSSTGTCPAASSSRWAATGMSPSSCPGRGWRSSWGGSPGRGGGAGATRAKLRPAIQTRAMLELTPAESLQQLNELMTSLGYREPHFATCAYALYDAVTGTCEVASAGHLPPLLVRPGGTSEFLDASPAPPLGVGEGLIQSRIYEIDDGSLLVLYTDGLVEDRHRDIDDGLSHLREIFGPGATSRSLDDLCRAAMAGVFAHHQRDDIAILIARLSRIPDDHHICWTLPHELVSARKARALVRDPLERWKLNDLLPTTELLVSELVTNAIRYAEGDVTLRLVLARTPVCGVVDSSAALPRHRRAARDDQHGRGLQVVSQLAQRWGARLTPEGKIVWCEQAVPADL